MAIRKGTKKRLKAARKGIQRRQAGTAKPKIQKACNLLRETLKDGFSSLRGGEDYAMYAMDDLAKAEGIVAGLRKTYRSSCGPNTMEKLHKLQKAIEKKYL